MIGKRTTSSRLRHRLTLQQEVQTPDNAGGYTRSWQDVAQLWAEIIPTSTVSMSKEILFAGQLQAQVTHKILLRYRAGVSAGMRLLFDNRAFNIRYVLNSEEAGETLEILAEEGVAA